MSDNIKDVVQAAMAAMQGELLGQIGSMMDARMSNMQRQVEESQKALADRQMAKINELQYNDGYRFKKRGNEQQFKFNLQVHSK